MKFNPIAWFITLSVSFIAYEHACAQEKISLEQVVALSLEKNYDVLLAKNTSEAAATNDHYAWGGFLPQLNANGAVVWNNNDQKFEFSDVTRNNEGNAQSSNTTGSVQLVWTLFDGTRMFVTRRRLDELAQQGELVVKDQMTNTISDVIINYYDIVRQKQQLKAITEQMAVSEERVKLAERKLQVGTGGKPELLQARVDLNAQRTQVIQQESVIAQLKEQLNALVDLKLPAEYDVADTIIIDLGLQQEQLATNIENSNYTLLALRKNMTVAELQLAEQKAALSPVFNFNAAYNYSRTNNTKLINPFSAQISQSNGFNYGFSVNIPILNNLDTRRLIEIERVNYDRQFLLYQQQKNAVNVGLKSSFVNYDNARKILLIEEENIGLAKENVFIALEGFKRGITTFIELRTAQQSLEDAYNSLITARYNAKLAETELLRLSGGLLK